MKIKKISTIMLVLNGLLTVKGRKEKASESVRKHTFGKSIYHMYVMALFHFCADSRLYFKGSIQVPISQTQKNNRRALSKKGHQPRPSWTFANM